MTDRQQPIATAQMLIRRPISVVFDAFVDPASNTFRITLI